MKIALNKETVRILNAPEMAQIRGGDGDGNLNTKGPCYVITKKNYSCVEETQTQCFSQ